MKILILTTFFTPNLSPGAFRMAALIRSLSTIEGVEIDIDLVTTTDNKSEIDLRYHSVLGDSKYLNVYKIYQDKNQLKLSQIFSYFYYARFSNKITKKKKYDLVFATSSKLATIILGYYIARKKSAKLYLDIRDLFVENLEEILRSKVLKKVLLPLLSFFERLALTRATKINIVSKGFISHVSNIAPNIPVSIFTNGIDELFADANIKKNYKKNNDVINVLYAGNIGEGQGLEKILPEAALKLGPRVHFKVIGSGAYKAYLVEKVTRLNITNISIHDPVKRDQLLSEYENADVLFLHLNDLEAFKKVIPSKIFEYGATGKPILAGVYGYPREFILDNLPDTIIIDPKNVEQLVEALKKFDLTVEIVDRSNFIHEFSRQKIMDKMAQEIIYCL